jgi:hypothetical protein
LVKGLPVEHPGKLDLMHLVLADKHLAREAVLGVAALDLIKLDQVEVVGVVDASYQAQAEQELSVILVGERVVVLIILAQMHKLDLAEEVAVGELPAEAMEGQVVKLLP